MPAQKTRQKYKGRARLIIRDLIDSIDSIILYNVTHAYKGLAIDLGGLVPLQNLSVAAQQALTLKTPAN